MVRTPPLHVIVADDHALIRELLERQLKELDADVRVYHAGTLQQVLELMGTAERLDLILLDLRMPGMNGFAGLQAVRQKRPDVPVAILSGQIEPQTIREALQAGAAGYLPKTMRAAGMLNALRLILDGERYVPESALGPSTMPGGETAGAAEFSRRERGHAIGHRENGNARMTNRARAKIGKTHGQIPCSDLLRRVQSTIPCQYFLYFRSIGIDNLEYYTLLYHIGV